MKQIYLYPIQIEACKEGGFLAICPLVQGCYAEGETIDEAVDNLKDVIKIVLEYKKKHLPKLSIPRVNIEKKKILSDLNVAVVR